MYLCSNVEVYVSSMQALTHTDLKGVKVDASTLTDSKSQVRIYDYLRKSNHCFIFAIFFTNSPKDEHHIMAAMLLLLHKH